jgi:hypothetical protein
MSSAPPNSRRGVTAILHGALALLLIATLAACGGSPAGDPAARPTLVNAIRDAEDLVIGHALTELMSNNELVEAARALCDLHDRLGPDEASQQTEALLRSLDWNAPANPAMLDLMLEIGRTTVCLDTGAPASPLAELLPERPHIGGGATGAEVDRAVAAFLDTDEGRHFVATIRNRQATLGEVFTVSMSDVELVRHARGICWTWAELGPDADAELRSAQEAYGWTGEADTEMFELLLDVADAACITVGA